MTFITDKEFFLLDVRDHMELNEEKINLVWSRAEIFSILTKEFPHAVKNYKLGGVLPPRNEEGGPSDLELRNLRKAGINSLDFTSEAVYASPGGGIATDGSSVSVTMGVSQYRQMFYSWTKYLAENEEDIRLQLLEKDYKIGQMDFGLGYNFEVGFFVYEKQTNVQLLFLSQKRYFIKKE